MYKLISMITTIIFLASCSKNIDEVASATWSLDESNLVVAVETLNITKGDLYPPIESSGVVSGVREAFIVSETRGIIEDVNFEIGDIVSSTYVLLSVDDSISKLSMEQAKQQYDSAVLDLKSIEAFYEKGTASLVQLSRARSSANGAKAFYETSLKAYEDNKITSSIEGAVAWKDKSITKGNYLNQGTKIARVVDMSKIRVELSLGERQIGLVELGAEAFITIPSLNNLKIKSTVIAIAAGSDLQTGSFSVIVEGENSNTEKIKSGMSSSVLIKTKSLKPEFIVPTDSIIQRDGKDYLFIDMGGVAEPIEILRGKAIGNRTVITNELKEDELLIISGLSSIKPGVKVNSRNIGKSGDWL